MAEWTVDLPATAVVGSETHVEDHNAIVDAVKEVRTTIDDLPEPTDGNDGQNGSRIYTTTGITGTSTEATVFEDSGIASALVYDYALNKSTGNLYVCSKRGNAATAEWKYDSNIKGPKGDDGEDGVDGNDGADGFPTEAQWDALVARVTALEEAAEA